MLKFTYPTSLADGSYYLVASAIANGTGTATAEAATASPISIAKPFVDFVTSFSTTPITVTAGGKDTAIVTIKNAGNITASGLLGLKLYASTGTSVDSSAQLLAAVASHRVGVKAGKTLTFKVTFNRSQRQAASTYNIIASSASSSTKPARQHCRG